ncbi:hypothetical protein ACH4S8_40205 [Streptomyces sp. NPDC021080]|uniref:hypothetical protein n=1 Tax=Streptomyces sp. NPDC021080 TaxID=3365110 RepID=UPI0037913571
MGDAETGGGSVVWDEMDETSDPEGMGDADREDSIGRRRLPSAAVVFVSLAFLGVVAGGLLWSFQDELFHPFGDARACEGSDSTLAEKISLGGVPIPADAVDVHYITQDGSAEVSFLSDQMPDYLHRAGLVPEGEPLFDENYGSAYAWGEGGREMPDGLCGPALKGPVWSYQGRDPDTDADILIERAPAGTTFRTPARVIASFDFGE